MLLLLFHFWLFGIIGIPLFLGTCAPRKSSIFDYVFDRSYFWISNRYKKSKLHWVGWLHNLSLSYATM